MRYFLLTIFGLTACGAVAILGLSVTPGIFECIILGLPFGCLAFPLLGCWFFLLITLGVRDLARTPTREHRRWGLWAACLMFATLFLLWFHVPQRVVFFAFVSRFHDLIEVPQKDGTRRWTHDRWIGPFYVDEFGTDRAGGFYFRSFTWPNGIGPDQLEFGFVFRPSREGVPCGRSRHRTRQLFGDWYVFEGSND